MHTATLFLSFSSLPRANLRFTMSSNNNEQNINYEHIKALVRDIHTTKNVARPDKFIDITLNGRQHHHQSSKASTSSSKSNILNYNKNHNKQSETHRLLIQKLDKLSLPSDADDDDSYSDDGDNTNKNQTASIIYALDTDKRHHTKEHVAESNFNIPSVVVTDVNEPLDLLQSTQRRFSQLYSGLRRLSTSHTVGSCTSECK